MKRNIEIIKCNEMIYKITIDGKLYEYTGTLQSAQKVKNNLDFLFNIWEEK